MGFDTVGIERPGKPLEGLQPGRGHPLFLVPGRAVPAKPPEAAAASRAGAWGPVNLEQLWNNAALWAHLAKVLLGPQRTCH